MERKSRGWCFTCNNWTEDDLERLKNIKCNYMIIGSEIGENGTPHLQGYVYIPNARSLSGMIKKDFKGCHLEITKGTPEQNKIYCSKQEIIYETGELPQKGKRTDLKKIKDEIINENRTVDDIALEDPDIVHKYGRTLMLLEDIRLRNVERTEMTTCTWYYGKTGTGKSHRTYERDSKKGNRYIVPRDGDWWDGYVGQETVILNDFRGRIQYEEMLQMIDKYPYHVRRRGRAPRPFTSKHVIITSSLPPWEIYKNRMEEDNIDQLLRRIKVIEVIDKDTELELIRNVTIEEYESGVCARGRTPLLL